jgi:ribosomal protein L21E
MGSQRVAKLSSTRQTSIQTSINEFSSRSPQANTQAARTAAKAIGSITRSSSFVQSMSSASVAKSVGYLVGFANRLKVKAQSADEALAQFGIGPDKQYPVAEFIANVRERLQEDLTSQQKATDPANAAADAIHRSVLDLLKKSVPAADVRTATREQLTEAFRKVSAREITSVLLEHVVVNLVNIIVDSASGGLSHAKVEGVKKRVGEEFASDFVKEVARLAKTGGVMPTQIPSKIPDWATDLERFASKYRD